MKNIRYALIFALTLMSLDVSHSAKTVAVPEKENVIVEDEKMEDDDLENMDGLEDELYYYYYDDEDYAYNELAYDDDDEEGDDEYVPVYEYEEEQLPEKEKDQPAQSDREARRVRRRRKKGKNQAKQLRRSCLAKTNNGTRGSCMGRQRCINNDGTPSGRCGPRGSICCIMEKSCSESTFQNNTIFVNNGYPSPDSGTGACSLTINRYNDNICQIRFDFVTLELSQPDADGNCVTDFLTVTGSTFASPIICGTNSDQHMYVDVDPQGGAVRLTVDRTAASMSSRMWNIKVSQIECTSKYKAPDGCLQYYTETSGTVSSFNFDQSIDEDAIPQTTRQIVNMNYAVCVQMADGYCSIMWSRNITGGDYAFTVSSNIAGLSRNLIGDPVSSSTSDVCITDFVVIPGAVDDLGQQHDRFCGAGFPNYVTTSFRPFNIYVKTDSNEQDDVLNRGFSLDYRQKIC